MVGGRVITWWDLIVESSQKPTFDDLASVLRRLHDVPPPVNFSLPRFVPMQHVLKRLEAAGPAISEPDREFMARRHVELQRAYETLSGPDADKDAS